jgi:hypothetical protein
MRLYIIGFMIGVIGLVAANQVRAGEGIDLRGIDLSRDGAFKVARGQTERAEHRLPPISNPECPDNILRCIPQHQSGGLS